MPPIFVPCANIRTGTRHLTFRQNFVMMNKYSIKDQAAIQYIFLSRKPIKTDLVLKLIQQHNFESVNSKQH